MLDNVHGAAVRRIARLNRKDARSETGLFLLEGPQAVREALMFRPELLREVYATAEAIERHPELDALAHDRGVSIELADGACIKAMADTVHPQGVVASCRQFPQSLRSCFARDGLALVAILERVRDPGNAGTILRAADAAGADAVVFTQTSVDVYNPKVVRSTTGSLFHMPVVIGASIEDAELAARSAGLRVTGADIHGADFVAARAAGELGGPTAWVFGNEAHGLSAEQLSALDVSWRLPMYGSAESLNLATAAAVCLYESALAQHVATEPGRAGN